MKEILALALFYVVAILSRENRINQISPLSTAKIKTIFYKAENRGYFWPIKYKCLKSKALFIINPISGGKNKDNVPELIKANLDENLFEPTIVYTNRAFHGHKLAKAGIGHYEYIIAVGGDGTVNEIASAVAGTDTILGVLPFGSGNGDRKSVV